jgi:hypothetical protein
MRLEVIERIDSRSFESALSFMMARALSQIINPVLNNQDMLDLADEPLKMLTTFTLG